MICDNKWWHENPDTHSNYLYMTEALMYLHMEFAYFST